MAGRNWAAIAGLAVVALPVQGCCGFGLWFAPGWANEWPGGLSVHVVWPAGMAAVGAVMVLTAAAGTGATFAGGEEEAAGRPIGRRAVRVWLSASLVVAGVAWAYLFGHFRAVIKEAWPVGYDPRGIAEPAAAADGPKAGRR